MRKIEIRPHGDMEINIKDGKLIVEFENEPEIYLTGLKNELLGIRTWFDQAFKFIGRNAVNKSWFTSNIESEKESH